MRGFDQQTNVVLASCHERVYSGDAETGVELIPLGLYVIRGDNVALIGEVDTEKDKAIAFDAVRAPPLKPVVH